MLLTLPSKLLREVFVKIIYSRINNCKWQWWDTWDLSHLSDILKQNYLKSTKVQLKQDPAQCSTSLLHNVIQANALTTLILLLFNLVLEELACSSSVCPATNLPTTSAKTKHCLNHQNYHHITKNQCKRTKTVVESIQSN